MPDLSIFSVQVIAIQGGGGTLKNKKRIKQYVFSGFSYSYKDEEINIDSLDSQYPIVYIYTIAPCVYMCEDDEFHNRNRKRALEMGSVGGQRLFEGLSHNITIIKWQATYFHFYSWQTFSLLCVFLYRGNRLKKGREPNYISMICLFFSGLEGVGCCCSSGGVYTIDRERKIPTTLIHQELADGDVLPPAASS